MIQLNLSARDEMALWFIDSSIELTEEDNRSLEDLFRKRTLTWRQAITIFELYRKYNSNE